MPQGELQGRLARRWAPSVVAIALLAVTGCSTPSGPTFADLGQIMTSVGVEPNVAWHYESVEQLFPQHRETLMQPTPADVVVLGDFADLIPGHGYTVTGDNPEPRQLPFDDPDALWRDAIITFDVVEVLHRGETRTAAAVAESGAITIKVIVPLDWSIEDVAAAYQDKPRAVVFLTKYLSSDHLEVLGGVGEFYLPVEQDGTLDISFLTETTREHLDDIPDHLDDVRRAEV